MVQLSLSDC